MFGVILFCCPLVHSNELGTFLPPLMLRSIWPHVRIAGRNIGMRLRHVNNLEDRFTHSKWSNISKKQKKMLGLNLLLKKANKFFLVLSSLKWLITYGKGTFLPAIFSKNIFFTHKFLIKKYKPPTSCWLASPTLY